jgi:hypothetical protein
MSPAFPSAGHGRLVLRGSGPAVLRGGPHHLDGCRGASLSAWRALPNPHRSLLHPPVPLFHHRHIAFLRSGPLAAQRAGHARRAALDECGYRPLLVLRVLAPIPPNGRVAPGQVRQYDLSGRRSRPRLLPRRGPGQAATRPGHCWKCRS